MFLSKCCVLRSHLGKSLHRNAPVSCLRFRFQESRAEFFHSIPLTKQVNEEKYKNIASLINFQRKYSKGLPNASDKSDLRKQFSKGLPNATDKSDLGKQFSKGLPNATDKSDLGKEFSKGLPDATDKSDLGKQFSKGLPDATDKSDLGKQYSKGLPNATDKSDLRKEFSKGLPDATDKSDLGKEFSKGLPDATDKSDLGKEFSKGLPNATDKSDLGKEFSKGLPDATDKSDLGKEFSKGLPDATDKSDLGKQFSKGLPNATDKSDLGKEFSKGLPDATDKSDLELKKIKALFPEPRMILNNLSAKTPEKVFDVHYKQYVAPKGVKKKAAQNIDWTCTYNFDWPEKMKFECTALSKRQAGEAAATQALHWLIVNNRIDSKGHPKYDKETLKEVRTGLNNPIQARVGEASVERIERIWSDYECGIREIFERTANEARHKVITAPVIQLSKDSTVDEDELSDSEDGVDEMTNLTDPEQKGLIHPVYGRVLRPPSEQTLRKRREVLQKKFEYYDESLTPLPIDEYADQITSALEKNKVAVIVGAAGCGKSTRVPAMVLRSCGVDAAVIVSEPRRVAAIGLADRVANEMGEEVGDSIGYQVRLNSKLPRPPAGSVLFCTSGVLLNRLQTNPGLQGCTHVIIDEAHERDVNTDITLLLLKRALQHNPQLKIVIMSATLDTDVFTRYFNSCPIIEVPGRTFPVEVTYLEDIEKKFKIKLPNTLANCQKEDGKPQLNVIEIVETIKAVDRHEKEGAILVFLPGWAEIKQAKQLLDDCYGQSGIHMILPVHSRLSTADQSKMFATPAPGIRKIVLATNIAETSITIPDVIYVIDSGAHKENTIREGTGTASLETVWVSLAGAKQRCGRAGRVQPGHCYRLYTKKKEAEFEPHTTPEILRVPLEKTVLDCKSYAPDDKAQYFLSQLPEPPSEKAVKFAVNDLIDIGALTPKEQLTRLGKALSTLQLSPRVGLSLVHAGIVGTALSTSNIVAHSDIEVFYNAAERREEIREIKRQFSPTSDHAALNWLQQEFEEKSRNSSIRDIDYWCQRYQVRKEGLGFVQSLSSLYLKQLLKTGLIEPTLEIEEMNRFSDVDELSIATLLSGVNALLVTRKYVKTKGKLRTINEVFSSTGDRAHIASESVNHAVTKRAAGSILAHAGARHSAERRALLVCRSSAVPPLVPLVFCKGDLKTSEHDGLTTVLSLPRHKLDIHVPTSQAETIVKAREMMWKTLQYYIDRDTRNLNYDEYTVVSRFKIRLVKAIAKILVEGYKESFEGKSVEDIR